MVDDLTRGSRSAKPLGAASTGAPSGRVRRTRRVDPERLRDVVIVALTVLTGATDAMAFVKLGGVFTSVMTGNMVLIGVAVGRGSLGALISTLVAFLAYIVGSLVGGRVAGGPQDDDPLWPPEMTRAFVLEFILMVVFATMWWATLGHTTELETRTMLGVCAGALGLQSSTILRLGVSGLSTTYLTGTLTTVVHAISSEHTLKGKGRAVAILTALIVGAALGASTAIFASVAAPVIQLVILGAAIVTGGTALVHVARPARTPTD
jgi:uncharacterized membrane protein YoaK (UPF0700 family)